MRHQVRGGADDGFTLLETLVALMVLAVAATAFARSVSMATAQMAGADRLATASVLGARLITETDTAAVGTSLEGTDTATGLKWRRSAEPLGGEESAGAAGRTFLLTVEIFNPASTEPLLRLQTAVTGSLQQ
ncbi:MAG: type II secretion system protein [Rhizobiaceae bacterium]